jgi:hypothetical protein
MPCRTGSWLPQLLALSTMLAATPSLSATPSLFHSPLDDGVNPGAPPVLSGSPTETLYLYLDAGPSATGVGVACVDGDGDELCQWELGLAISGDASVASFTPDAGQDIVWASSGGALDATGGKATVGELGPIRIGELEVSITGGAWSANVAGGSIVDAGFALDGVHTGTIAMPEPGLSLQLLAGGAALLVLARRRVSR